MSDYCVNCGDAEQGVDSGDYVSFEDLQGYGIWIERWVCESCIRG